MSQTSRPAGHGPVPAYDWIAHHASHRPTREAVRDLGSGRSFTYADLNRRIDAMAAYLTSLGIGRGDRVGVLAHNGVEFFDIQFACARTGSICVLLNWRLTVPELEYILNDSSPMLLIHDTEFADAAAELQRRCSIDALLAIDGGTPDSPYEQAMAEFDGQAADPVALTHDDVITIMYTSGTTGLPKGAMITHGMNFWNCVNLGIPAGLGLDTVHLNILPLFHTGGLNCYSNPVLHAGGTVVLLKTFEPGETLRVLGDPTQGITHFFAVPAPYQFMMQHPDFDDTDLSRLKIAGVGGAPCALTIMERWTERGVLLAQGFGMTETSPACIFLDPGDALRKIGSTGKALLHTEYRIVAEDGADCAPDEVGELWLAGPNITPGYWNRPDATQDAFEGRWLKTGDAARVDAEGFVYIVDRWKDMYISGGENVYPAEVENVLYQIPGVTEAAVIGVPHDRWGEVGLAVLAVEPGATVDRKTVIEHCVERLAKFKVPNDITIVEALPRNATGKVLKRDLREELIGTEAPRIS
ncbi:MAG: long-chain fatty acid--CoA ligase [Actinomycetia bacterium]|nr:long-chain fatty acid--CoA ligase [Actinomycetes bacterium]MCP4959867.1 long-chain fatty acid--CoA ligase [Actinomycetes bacterium]